MATQRIISAEPTDAREEASNHSLRPTRLAEYVGQVQLIEKLSIALEAVQQRGEPMEHVLLHGPPGLGKTTLAHVIANEMGTHLTVTAGPAMTKAGDLVGIVTKLAKGDVLFIDEVHRMPVSLEEYLYSAMEDFKIDVQIDSGMHARTITLPLQPFTLIGATTRAGLLSGPMRSRFGITHSLDFYGQDELLRILHRSAKLLAIDGMDGAADDPLVTIARRSRGTPRIANRLLRRVRDFSQVRADSRLDSDVVDQALTLEGVDDLGLDDLDRRYLRVIGEVYEGGPVGLEAIAATLGEDSGTLEAVVEPYLLQIAFLARTRKGRQLTRAGAEHLGMSITAADDSLFEGE